MSKRHEPEPPQADRIDWWKCEVCDNLHILLTDDANQRFLATAVVDREMLKAMAVAIEEPPDSEMGNEYVH